MFTTREKKINREPKKGGRANFILFYFFPFFAIFAIFALFAIFAIFAISFVVSCFFSIFFFLNFIVFGKLEMFLFLRFRRNLVFSKFIARFIKFFLFFFSVKLDLLYRTFPSPLLGETSQKYRKTRKNKKTKRATRAPARHAPHGSPRFSLIWCSVFL